MTARRSKPKNQTERGHPARWRRVWPRVKQVLFIAFALAVLGLIGWRAREIDWNDVLRALPPTQYTTRRGSAPVQR